MLIKSYSLNSLQLANKNLVYTNLCTGQIRGQLYFPVKALKGRVQNCVKQMARNS